MKALAGVAVLSFLFLVAPPFPATAQEMTDAEQSITDRWAAYEKVLLSGDVDGWLSYWTPDARVLGPGMDMSADDLPSYAGEFWEPGGEVFTFAMESFEIFIHGDVAYQIGQFDESFQYAGEEPTEAHNYFFARWEIEDGIWKIDRWVTGAREAPAEG